MKVRKILLTLLLCAAFAGLVALIYYLVPSSSVETAEVLLPSPSVSTAPESGMDSQLQLVEVTPGTVQAVIATLSRVDSYARTLTAESFWSGGSSQRVIDVQVRGSSARLTISSGAGAVKNVLISGDELWIWYGDSDAVYHGAASERDADEYQSLLTYEDLLALDPAAIFDAGYTDYNGEYCIYARYTDGALGYESCFWISVATGLLMGSETYDEETLVSRLSSSAPDISTPDDAVFAPP